MKKEKINHEGTKDTKRLTSPKDILLPYQRKWADDDARFKIGVWSRQTGKSFSTAEEAVEDSIRDKGTMWVCLSAGERQALEWMEKAKQWAEAFKLAIEDYAEDRDTGESLMKAAEIRWSNGSRLVAVPANAKTARGYSANVVLDEFAYHEDPNAIWRAMYPSITNPLKRKYKLRVVSTFNGRGNKFFDLWEKAKDNGYSAHMVTIHDAVAQGLPVNIEELKKALDDAEGFAQEYECVPLDGSNVLLPYELIAMAESAEASEFQIVESMAAAQFYAGIDFGRQNDPTVCWLVEQVGDILWTREVLVLEKMDTPNQQELLRSRIKLCKRVSFDYTGPGVGLGDYLAKDFGQWVPVKHQFGKMDLCTFSKGFKREIFPKLRKKFEAPTKIRIPISRVIREDLHAMQQVVHNGEYDYWAPRTREGHSDRCTAAALAVRAAGDGNDGWGYA
jgi:phage FluMu gp28-like protein